jgi:hypothetical protein
MSRNNYLGLMSIMAKSGWGLPTPKPYFPSTPKPVKQCLECGKEHRHNNSWCSSECCKKYRDKL